MKIEDMKYFRLYVFTLFAERNQRQQNISALAGRSVRTHLGGIKKEQKLPGS